MKNYTEHQNNNKETYYSMETSEGYIYSFSTDFEDYWTDAEQEIYGK